MNNLILSIIAIVFAVGIVTAGVSYLPASIPALKKQTVSVVNDIENMSADYLNLKINVGHQPSANDYNAIYSTTSSNSNYSYQGGSPARVSSLPGTSNWLFETSNQNSYFCLDIPQDSNTSLAKLKYQAVLAAAKNELIGNSTSRLGYMGKSCSATQQSGSWGAATISPGGWPDSSTAVNSAYSLVLQLTPNDASVTGCTCSQGSSTYACNTSWNGTSSVSASCPQGTFGTASTVTTTPYTCTAGNVVTGTPSTSLNTSGCINYIVDPVYSSTCNSTCGPGSYNLSSWTCGPTGTEYNSVQCEAAGVSPPAATSGSCTGNSACVAIPSWGACSNSCSITNGPGTSTLLNWTCGPAGNASEFSAAQCSSFGVPTPSQACNVTTGCAVCGSAKGSADSDPPWVNNFSNLCSSGTAGNGQSAQGTWSWNCVSSDGTTTTACTAPETTNSACGSANNGASTITPPWSYNTGNLCSVGTASNETVASGYWTWNCGTSTDACHEAIPTGWWASKWTGYACGNVTLISTTVQCMDSNNIVYPDSYCAFTKPASISRPYDDTNACASCGSAASVPTAVVPWSAGYGPLCSTGLAANPGNTNDVWQWNCVSVDGTQTVPCSATQIVSGACGSANNGPAVATPPWSTNTGNLCTAGYASSETNNGNNWSWTCVGNGGGTSASCKENEIVNGTCGSDNGTTATGTPPWTGNPAGLCSAGTATTASETLSGTNWQWSCAGSNGGTTASCTQPESIAGVCGTLNGVTSATAPWSISAAATCATGIAGNEGEGNNGAWTWLCAGSNGGATASCQSPINGNYGVCGSASNNTVVSLPPWETNHPSALCSGGELGSNETISNGKYVWTCVGPQGSATCSAPGATGVCGSANNGPATATQPQYNLCATGDATFLPSANGKWNWTCTSAAGTASCSEAGAVGVCGSANNGPSTATQPVYNNLCATGSATFLPSANGKWKWTCTGPGGTVSCSEAGPNAVCGSANNGPATADTPYYNDSSTALCSTGMLDSTGSSNGNWTWTCEAGSIVSCSEPQVTVTCGSANNGPASATDPLNNDSISTLCGDGVNEIYSEYAYGYGPNGNWQWYCVGPVNTVSCSEAGQAGTCGAANNGSATTIAPWTNNSGALCSFGTVGSKSSSNGNWTWTCTGPTGITTSCKETDGTNGACGSDNNAAASMTAPWSGASGAVCSAGTLTPSSEAIVNGYWDWSCAGINGGTAASCTQPLATHWWATGWTGYACGNVTLTATSVACMDSNSNVYSDSYCVGPKPAASTITTTITDTADCAHCGSAAGVAASQAPENTNYSNLCSTGVPAASTGAAGTWAWTCTSENGSATVTCSAPEQVNGTCGTDNSSTAVLTPPWTTNAGGLCATGTPASETTANGVYSWTCQPIGTGTTASCQVPMATKWWATSWTGYACGTVTLTSTAVQCMDSINDIYPDSDCAGPKPASVTQTYVDTISCATCGTGGTLCAAGSISQETDNNNVLNWNCVSADATTTVSCSQTQSVTGTCGTVATGTYVNAPWGNSSTALCATGTPASETSSGGFWTWSCDGANGGSNALCSAIVGTTN